MLCDKMNPWKRKSYIPIGFSYRIELANYWYICSLWFRFEYLAKNVGTLSLAFSILDISRKFFKETKTVCTILAKWNNLPHIKRFKYVEILLLNNLYSQSHWGNFIRLHDKRLTHREYNYEGQKVILVEWMRQYQFL